MPDELVGLAFVTGPSDTSPPMMEASSALRFLVVSSEIDESIIGQTNPVRGV